MCIQCLEPLLFPCVSHFKGNIDLSSFAVCLSPCSISESFLTVKGAALFLPRGNGSSTPRISHRRNKHAGNVSLRRLSLVCSLLFPSAPSGVPSHQMAHGSVYTSCVLKPDLPVSRLRYLMLIEKKVSVLLCLYCKIRVTAGQHS